MEQLSIDIETALGVPELAEQPALRLTEQQREAVRRRREAILLSAAAGSGKTSVLVERFVQAVRDDGIAPAAVLAITFTDRAAGELRSRVRERLLALGERAAARDTEAAFIGTFHGFCSRLLRAHPLPAGLDPEFRVIDAGRAGRLREQAFESALVSFLADRPPEAVDLLAAYSVDGARETVERLYAELRSRGELQPRLPAPPAGTGAGRDEADALVALAGFDRLLGLFGDCYERLKHERMTVDFDDLELLAGALLADNEPVRRSWSEGFELLMVDEFQDTNPRQLALLRALERDNLFSVGDELQSIYGFRHADVSLFRARREELAGAGGALVLASNFRSHEQVLAAVNTVFSERFEHFTGLVHGREEEPAAPSAEARVELLLTCISEEWKALPGAAAISAGLPQTRMFARQAEARLLAQRVRELIDAGEARAGEIAVLLRASGDIETFERALQLQGLRTLASVGTFWGRQQITDLYSYLRALANPKDEEALYSTLASPLAGCSRDALARLASLRRDHGGLWNAALALAAQDAGVLGEADDRRLRRFCAWFEVELAQATRLGISQLLERAIVKGRYAEHVRALDWAERRLANLHKLLRLARAFEAQEGRDLRAFVDHVEHLKRAAVKEPEAPVERVEPDTVQLMTVHTAKGLEFPVVCVADLGRRKPSPADGLFVDGARLGLRLARAGEGDTVKTLDYEELRAERRAREREEEDRVFYVAMTRARERLLLSGTVNFAAWPRENDTSPPLSWLGPALIPGLAELVQQGPGVRVLTAAGPDGPPVRLTVSDPAGYGSVLREPPAAPPAEPAAAAAAPVAPAEPEPATAAAETRPGQPATAEAAPLTEEPALTPPPTISYTSLSLLERCGYRYYLERVLRMPEERLTAAEGADSAGLEARARGTLVHALMEHSDLGSARGPSEEQVAAAAKALALETRATDRAEVAALIDQALRAPLAARLAAAGRCRREHPFAFSLAPNEPLVTGVIDLLCEEADGTALVIDYKSDRLVAGAELEQLVARDYAVQRLLYALAVLREGALVVEVVHWFLERPHEPAIARYTLAERPALEEQLASRLAEAWADRFAVTAHPHRALCLTCPGRGSLCSWGEEMTMRELPDAR